MPTKQINNDRLMSSFDGGTHQSLSHRKSSKKMTKVGQESTEDRLSCSAYEPLAVQKPKDKLYVPESPKGTAYQKLAQIAKSVFVPKQQANVKSTTKRKGSHNRYTVGGIAVQLKDAQKLTEPEQNANLNRKSVKTSDFIQNIKLKLATMKGDKTAIDVTGSPQGANTSSKNIEIRNKYKGVNTTKLLTVKTGETGSMSDRRQVYTPSRLGRSTQDIHQAGPLTSRAKEPALIERLQLQNRKSSISSRDKLMQHRRQPLNKSSLNVIEASRLVKESPISTSFREDRVKPTLKKQMPQKNSAKVASMGVSASMLSKIVTKLVDTKNNSFVHD